ncbi:hypothetical protein H0H92_005604 [Tricholoma furcatifolium]|nr:hypothetical protein H0H92_005604 [Tricholoma furcatifolium]
MNIIALICITLAVTTAVVADLGITSAALTATALVLACFTAPVDAGPIHVSTLVHFPLDATTPAHVVKKEVAEPLALSIDAAAFVLRSDPPASADQPANSTSNQTQSGTSDSTASGPISHRTIAAIVIVLFLFIFTIVFLHVWRKHYPGPGARMRRQSPSTTFTASFPPLRSSSASSSAELCVDVPAGGSRHPQSTVAVPLEVARAARPRSAVVVPLRLVSTMAIA